MKLFVGGISQDTTEEDLANYFQSFGPIGACVIVYDKVTHASKGYAFITCENSRTVQRILQLKEHRIQDRVVEVTEALGRQGYSGEEAAVKGPRRLFVGGLSFKCTRDDLLGYFAQFGEVLNAYIIFDPKTGASKSFGYVEFATIEDAFRALNHPVHYLNNKPVTVEIHKNGSGATSATASLKKSRKQNGQNQVGKQANHYMNDLKHSQQGWEQSTNLNTHSPIYDSQGEGEFFFDDNTPLVITYNGEMKNTIVPFNSQEERTNHYNSKAKQVSNTFVKAQNFEGWQDFTSWPTPIRARRPFKTFYKNLKRTHVQKRLASLVLNEENYVYHKERASRAVNRLALAQIAYPNIRS